MINHIKEIADACVIPFYKLAGRRPWIPGYYTARKRCICKALDQKVFASTDNLRPMYGVAMDERVVEYPWVFSQMPAGPLNVLDAGSSLNHSFLLNRLAREGLKLTIMTLAPEKRCFWSRSVSYLYGDVRRSVFATESFDVVASISTIEHIGLNNTVLYTADASMNETDSLGFVPAIKEFRRILKPGGLCLITVPYGRRDVRDWYQVFDSTLVRRVIDAFQPSEAHIEYFGYSSNGWHRAKAEEVADAVFHEMTKSACIAPDKAAAARAVACLKLVA